MWFPATEYERKRRRNGLENFLNWIESETDNISKIGLRPYEEKETKVPEIDVKENKNNITVDVGLPGMDKENIDLNINEDSIEVSAAKEKEKEDTKEGKYVYRSMARNFYRRIPLPSTIEKDNAKATFKNGVLEIEAPKEKNSESVKINIE